MAVRYATRDQLSKQLSSLRLKALSGSDATVQDDCIEAAAGVVDLYLSASPTPTYDALPDYGQQIVRDLTLTIAVYKLADRVAAITDRIREQYEDAIFRLKDISQGKASLGSVGTTAAPAQISMGGAARVFRRGDAGSQSGTMGGW